ncbi:PX-associated domain-containing protein [Hirsutella rhossiliensis]|uniref:PX-associated domain-containing protein n=1 Tax=Hirsutella rhossiliensis TaxID=111463 RepID=A0A9P8SEM2_9HYPO|nr:PX-associated domain-containing protein [Hirsutella rhossiliensis]KAH0959973.1 PX-associated domain-containing protein [Hirsutella rhossiliensis]
MIMACPQEAALAPEQRRALFDILTHYQTYADIVACKEPGVVARYGYPFDRSSPSSSPPSATSSPTTIVSSSVAPQLARLSIRGNSGDDDDDDDFQDADDGTQSSAPLLQTLLTQFVLPLPGVKDMPPEFWSVRVHGMIMRLAQAELSESYDKGALGTRKTLATGSSALLEMVARGTFGGVPRKPRKFVFHGEYDCSRAEDLERAWEDLVQGLVYGDMVDDFFDHMDRTEDLESHSPGLKAVAEYVLIQLAAGAHHVFIRSPEGPYLLKLVENVHGLIPYKLIKQTLRVGNAATMMSGMMRILLAKLSVTSVTNWIGITSSADDGMNLLQRIISLVLSWDAGDFRKSADKVERAKERERPSDEVLRALRDHVARAERAEHEAVRAASAKKSQSIIVAILEASSVDAASLTETQHAQCLEYYSALLSVRDRDSITAALCREPPDLLTQAVKDAVAAYDPMIRSVHARVDLKEHLDALQGFIDELIKASKPSRGLDGKEKLPTVDDYVKLLRKNRGLLYRWVHAIATKAPDVWSWFRDWANASVVKFRQAETPTGVSAMEARLDHLFVSLDPRAQRPVLDALDAHAAYLSALSDLSLSRLQALVDSGKPDKANRSVDAAAPGMYLSRWQALLDETLITPAAPSGAVRHGSDVKHITTMGKTGASWKRGLAAATPTQGQQPQQQQGPVAPDVGVVVRALAAGFGGVIREMAAEVQARDAAATGR